MQPVTLRGPGYSHEYVVGRRTGDSRLRGNDGEDENDVMVRDDVMGKGHNVMGVGYDVMVRDDVMVRE